MNRLPADDSHEISRLILFEKLKKYFKMSSAAVLIGALRVELKSITCMLGVLIRSASTYENTFLEYSLEALQ